MLSRRAFLAGTSAVPLLAGGAARAAAPPPTGLRSITGSVKPISPEEREARIVQLQSLMSRQKIGALLVESGSTLEYFTGIRWRRSERTTAAVIPAHGTPLVVTPAFEEPSVRETLQVAGDVRTWNEPDNPFERMVQCLRDRGVAAGSVAAEPTLRFFIVDGMRRVSSAYEIVSGDALVRVRHKSPGDVVVTLRRGR